VVDPALRGIGGENGASLRKCAATTDAPALTGRVRSTTDGVLARLSVMLVLRPHPEEGACKVGDVRNPAA